MILINKVLKERYKLTELIAEGGMASVYKATDLLLQRTVAIKVLKQNLALDRDGIERFYREARSAAKLSHPSIINIFDIGSDEQIYFIVMEYLPGGTLDKLVTGGKPLPVKDIIKIGMEVCDALQFAHEKGVIHRDIKPQNIMLTEDKKIKVVDFGIARPLDSLTMTSPGTLIGSVYYFSPEQAEGKEATILSDVYSTGVLLYYLSTGSYPFDGENAVAIALKHIKEAPKKPGLLSPEIPEKLEKIILKAMEKEPEKRHNSAGHMLEEIKSLQETLYAKTETINKETLDRLKSITKEDAEKTLVRKGPPPLTGDKKTGKKEDNTMTGHSSEEETAEEKRIHPLLLILLLGLIIIIGVPLGMMLPSIKNRIFTQAEKVEVPYLLKKTEEEAIRVLNSAGLRVELAEEYSDKIPAGQVISQKPFAGTDVEKGSAVKITVSLGEEGEGVEVTVPYIRGKKVEEAEKELLELGLELIVEDERETDEQSAGTIISQEPKAGSKIKKPGQIRVVISAEKDKIIVPELKGLTEEEAEKILRAKKLKLKIGGEKNSELKKGLIIEQDPEGGTGVKEDTVINVTISSGPRMIPVPDIRGLSIEEAENFLKELNLHIMVTGSDIYEVDRDLIETQNPEGGEKISEGGTVEVTVKTAQSKDMVMVPDVTGKLLFDAKNKLLQEKLIAGTITEISSSEIPGTVLAQEPKGGTEVKENTPVDLIVSKEEDTGLITVPDLTGMTKEEGIKELEKAGLKAGKTDEVPSDMEEGTIVEQSPQAGSTVKENTEINLVVAKKDGGEKIVVPSLTGMNIEDAINELKEVGLGVGNVETKKSGQARGTVLAQDPPAGTYADKGRAVHLKISE